MKLNDKNNSDETFIVKPINIPDFKLLGKDIDKIVVRKMLWELLLSSPEVLSIKSYTINYILF